MPISKTKKKKRPKPDASNAKKKESLKSCFVLSFLIKTLKKEICKKSGSLPDIAADFQIFCRKVQKLYFI
jgi:hypothetical protein